MKSISERNTAVNLSFFQFSFLRFFWVCSTWVFDQGITEKVDKLSTIFNPSIKKCKLRMTKWEPDKRSDVREEREGFRSWRSTGIMQLLKVEEKANEHFQRGNHFCFNCKLETATSPKYFPCEHWIFINFNC